jgi:micrococcal nuclease
MVQPGLACLLALVLVACAAPGAATGDPSLLPRGATETARVVSVVDGDTIRVDRGNGSEAVRYIGIDTPETDPGIGVEPLGEEATAANAALVRGREVVLERDVSETDRFGRLLRYVWVLDGADWTLVNLELLERGMAQVSTFPPDVRHADRFLVAQRRAMSAGIGLWAGGAQP